MPAPPRYVLVNGRLHLADAPVIRADDRGFLYGDGAFETLRIIDGAPRAWRRHLARLRHSLDALQIPTDGLMTLRTEVDTLLSANGFERGEVVLRISISRGPGVGAVPPSTPQPTRLLRASPAGPGLAARRRGVDGVSWRLGARSAAGHKTLAYLPSVIAAQACAPAEPFFVDADGGVLEGATCNLFVVTNGGLWTPPTDGRILPGVARATVLDVAAAHGVAVREARLPVEALRGAEAFVTNAALPLAPLRSFDGEPLATPGRLQRTLRAEYDRYTDA